MRKIGIVSHDAGGAELLSNWLLSNHDTSYLYQLSGPAIEIFQKNLGAINLVSSAQLFDKCNSLICGTSWQSTLEVQAIKKFKKEGKRTVAFLDHWVNYRERFLLDNKLILPDEIWTADLYAEQIARKCFPSTMIKKKLMRILKKLKRAC